MRFTGVWPLSVCVVLIPLLCSVQSAYAQRTFLRGKIQAVGQQGITVVPRDGEGDEAAQPVFVAAGRQTQVRMNVLAAPDRIRPGAYVEMRVLWDGQSTLRATSIKFPEGRATKFGLYKG